MNLYIWAVSANLDGSVVVMASNLRQARKIAEKQCANWADWKDWNETVKLPQLPKKPTKVIRNRPYAAYFVFCE